MCFSIAKIFIFILLFSFLSQHLSAQDRRGLFLQDNSQGASTSGSSFRVNGEEAEEETDSLGFPMAPGMPGSSRTGMREGSGSVRGLIYQVHVLGEVKNPGTLRVAPTMRVTDALLLTGGMKKGGSERFVELRKPGQIKGRVLDLFAYKTLGQITQNPYLEDNDTIFVPLKKRAIEIEGPVRRPGIFELKSERNLEDILDLAGGFTVGVDPKNTVKVIRYGGTEDKVVLEVLPERAAMRAFAVLDGDVIVVPHKFLAKNEFDYNLKQLPNDNIFYPANEDRVFVIGAVRVPGAFEFNQYYSLRQYLTLAGGTTTMAKNGKIKVVSIDGRSYKAKDGNYDRVINPGDTIVVPEKSIPSSFYIGLLPTIASLGLSAAALFK